MGLLEEYLVLSDEYLAYEQTLKQSEKVQHNELSIEPEQQEVQGMYAEWKDVYKKCIADPECEKKDKTTIRKKRVEVHSSYIKYMAIIGSIKAKIKEDLAPPVPKSGSSIAVPPCDTEIFQGDYLSWPSFRDLFTAIYVNNKKLSAVEKLYHLFQKTTGEAREINRHIPLTSEGFEIAWENLRNQYENKRIVINNQLRTIFNLPQCAQECSNGLKKLQREINNAISVLKLYKIDIGSWDPIFIYQCSSKLPKLTLSLWEQSVAQKTEIPKWEELDKFLTERFHALESVSDIYGSQASNSSLSQRQKYNNFDKSKSFKVHHTKVNAQKCNVCKGNHFLRSCPKFISMNYKNRISIIKRDKYCLNCLTPGHMVAECHSQKTCSECKLKHHTLLHRPNLSQSGNNNQSGNSTSTQSSRDTNIQSTVEQPSTSTSGNVRAYHTSVSRKTMLATAWVTVIKDGLSHKARALIDPCADDSFVSERLRKLLNLSTRTISADISGLGGEHLTRCTKLAILTIGSVFDKNFSLDIDALVVPDVTGNVPTHSFENFSASQLPKLNFADPHFYISGPVDILIGGNLYPLILLNGVQHGILGSLVAQKTVFGWIVTGPTSNRTSVNVSRVAHCTRVSIDKQLSRFWEIEELPREDPLSEEDKICENIYRSTVKRDSTGRFTVDLPFKTDPKVGSFSSSNRYVALSQFLRNEQSLARKPELKAMYDDVINEYLSLGHMEVVEAPNGESEPYFYLPHHGVYKPESVSTKLRVVFNASCPSVKGQSLNDLLYVGPVLQKDIVSLILNWRLYKFVFNADITKMYRQIFVNPKHAPFQRILYRSDPDMEIKDYQLKTVTFGINCAPYLALRTLLQLAEDEEKRFPLGSRILRNNMYVDDALAGAHSVSEGIQARKELERILLSGGFELRKWTSNAKEVLEGLPRDRLLNEDFLNFDDKSSAKTLGIRWNAKNDSFYFVSEKLRDKENFTKREVLSVIARLFDPLGWLSPVIITAKIFMQQLSLDEIEWDDSLKPLSLIKWKSFIQKYVDIDRISIPRWVRYCPESEIEFHGFCDSSELAYAAVLYSRVNFGGEIHTSLLVSKSRVAPIKKLSLPRLELCGALLLAELIAIFFPQLDVASRPLYLWSDSTIVLSWLKKPSHTWTTFVANRVAKIQEKVGDCWRHVSTFDNPADLATRGVTPSELKENNLWWSGPSWLKDEERFWPSNINVPETSIEAKPVQVHIARSADFEDILERFSCLSRAIHVIAYMLRFFHATHPTSKGVQKFETFRLTSLELASAKNRLISLSQKLHFPQEYFALFQRRPIDSKSALLTLTPFIDKDQLIRANGRLGSTLSLSYSERHPVILSHRSYFSKLYVRFIHKLTLHGGPQLMLATIRLECWILRAKNVIRTCVRNCKDCVIARKAKQGQIMAALPPERTTYNRPFTNTGVDYAGPFDLKNFSGRGCRITKCYICLFVCFSTKAIHLEVVSDSSTAAFMAALSRFVSRRGYPHKIFSDNGRNFVGAAREIRASLAKSLAELKSEAMLRYGHQKLEWHFIPASAPHMGGLWEAGVKSCKTHLKKISGQIRHTYEEFSTILASIEACLNSRPLIPMTEGADDFSVLTPAYFLIGSSLLSPAEPEEIPGKISLQNRWRRLKIVQQDFCRRWKSDYLKELHKRNKWQRPLENLKIGDMVVLRQEPGSPNEWRLGRITKVYAGSDGQVRVVDLKTPSGSITRPVHKLVLLPRTE
ncbi:uncharacterized protein LOC142229664 [Haematobia irritans]|uniref:uncharacterized protein LOC142229664 n=1 Tax=Haematobia irritans TaxID=7368 RepID=UPI003F50A8B5